MARCGDFSQSAECTDHQVKCQAAPLSALFPAPAARVQELARSLCSNVKLKSAFDLDPHRTPRLLHIDVLLPAWNLYNTYTLLLFDSTSGIVLFQLQIKGVINE